MVYEKNKKIKKIQIIKYFFFSNSGLIKIQLRSYDNFNNFFFNFFFNFITLCNSLLHRELIMNVLNLFVLIYFFVEIVELFLNFLFRFNLMKY